MVVGSGINLNILGLGLIGFDSGGYLVEVKIIVDM